MRYFCIGMFLFGLVAEAQNTVTIDGSISDWADEFIVSDLDGCDDINGQNDIVLSGAAYSDPFLYLLLVFDEVGLSGQNTADACWLFDDNGNGLADAAICFSLGNNPFTLDGADVFFYTCNDSAPNGCGSPTVQVQTSLSCMVASNVPELMGYECGNPNDSAVECGMDVTQELAWLGGLLVLGSCSYPSASLPSSPSDCTFEIANNLIVVDPMGGSVPVELMSFEIK